MITYLNPKVSESIAVVSVISLVYSYVHTAFSLLSFFIGMLAALPLIISIWITIEHNWKDTYKKFYSMDFHKRNAKIIYQSWKLTWWIVHTIFDK